VGDAAQVSVAGVSKLGEEHEA